MIIKRNPIAYVTSADVGPVLRRETTFRKTVELACRAAIQNAGRGLPLPKELNAGIAFFTSNGENFAAHWREQTCRGKPLRPTQFESAIHNAAAGYCAIQLGLIGPQIVLVGGNIGAAARLQLLFGRSRFMLVCEAHDSTPASCYVLEAL